MDDPNDMREAFEKQYGPRDSFFWRNEDGSYKVGNLQSAWKVWQDACAWQARAAQSAPSQPSKFWLWKNFIGGEPQYLAFDNPYPTYLDSGDPQTLGEPCGYALLKPSRNGRPGVDENAVIERIKTTKERPQHG